MPLLYKDSQGCTRKRTREEIAAAIERINSRTIVIERWVLKPDIKVAPFDFIYYTFQEIGWLSLFDVVDIYLRLVYEFYRNLKIVSIH